MLCLYSFVWLQKSPGSLNSNKRLTTLRISGAGEVAAFADALQRNVVLRELEWKDALLEGSGAQSLAKALETNSFLGFSNSWDLRLG